MYPVESTGNREEEWYRARFLLFQVMNSLTSLAADRRRRAFFFPFFSSQKKQNLLSCVVQAHGSGLLPFLFVCLGNVLN